MSLYRIVITSVNGSSSVPTYPTPFVSTVNEVSLAWNYTSGSPPLPTSFSALEIIAVNVDTGQTERVRLGAPSLTVGMIAGLERGRTYDVQVVGYDVNNDPLAFSRPVRVEIPLSASQSIEFFPVLRIQRTLNYVNENYIQVTTNSSSESIEVVWASTSGATQWRLWYNIATQGEYIDTNFPPQQTLSTTNTTILPNHSSGTRLYVLKVKAYNASGNELGTTRTYAFYWTIIVPSEPPPPPCSYQVYDITAQQNITSTNHTILLLSSAGVRSIRIIASCPYSIAFSGNGWARLSNAFNTYTAGFDGNEDFPIYYDENTSAQSRSATLVVRNRVNSAIYNITLLQSSSSSAPLCIYTITTNPAYNSVRPSDNAFVVVVGANTTSIQVTVNTSTNCRYVFFDQFSQFSSISSCVSSPCTGTNTVTISFPANTSTNVIERAVNINNPDTNQLIRRIVVRQLAPVTEYPLPNFVVPPTPYSDKVYLFDSDAKYDIFHMHDGGSTIEVSMYSDARGVIANFGFQNFIKITATRQEWLPVLNQDYFYWRLRDSRNTQMLYKTQRFVFVAYNLSRAKFTAPTTREFFVPPSSGISITFEWNIVSWANSYRLYMFSQNVLVHDVTLSSTTSSYTYTFSRAQLESLKNGELYVELISGGYVTDQIVLRFTNLPPPPPPPPPPDDNQIMDIVEHVFLNQTLVSGDVAKSGFELRVWEIYGYDFATVFERKSKTWQSSDGSELRVITVAPDVEHTVQKSILRSEAEFPSYTLQLTELFPVREVFKRFYEGQTNKPLMYYMRLTLTDNTGVYSVCEGVVRLPFETTLYKFKHHTSQGEVLQAKAFSVQLFHPASLLKFTNPIDQRSRTISYTRTPSTITSNGKGLIDYIRNAFNSGVLIRIIDVFDVVLTWLNEASVLAKAGIFDSVKDTNNDPIYSPVVEVVGLGSALALLRLESDSLNVARFSKQDLLWSRIYIDSFLHSDSYGDPKTKQKSGELRDYSVELTRGLRDSKGKFPKEEKEFSFLNANNALEILQMLASSAHCNIYFDVRRIANTFRIIIVLERTGIQRTTYRYNRSAGNFDAFYFARQQAFTIENPHEQTLTNETLLISNIRVSEINGAGNEREDRSLLRTELNDLLVYEADESDTLNAMMGAISVERRLALASVFASSYEFVLMESDRIRRTLTLPSNRALEQHEREFYVRLALQNVRASQTTLTFTQNNNVFTVQFYAPTWYIVEDASADRNTILRFTGNVFVGRYFAEALYGYHLNKVRKSVKVLRICAFVPNALLFKEHYTLIAQQRFGELAENTILKPRHFRVDVVQGKIEGEFEVLDNVQVENDSPLLNVEFNIRYDQPPPSSTSHRPRYTIPLRRTGYNYGAGTSIYGDGWKGYRLLWSIDSEYENYSIIIFRYINHTLQYIHEVALTERSASTGLEFRLTNYNIINTRVGRYVLVLMAHRTLPPNPTVLVRKEYVVFDVDYGFLNASVPHSLIHSLKDLATQGAVRVQFAFAWFAGKDQIVTVMSSEPELDIGTALCVFVRDGFLHVGKFSVNKTTNTFNYSNVQSCDLSQVPAGGGVHNKVNVEIDINNTANTAVFRIDNTVYPSVGYAYSDSQFNTSELTTLALGITYFNVCVRDERSAKVHGEYIRIFRGSSFSSLTLAFEKYFDNDIGKVLVETEKGRVFIDEGKNIAKF